MKQVELDKYPFTLTIKVRDYEVDAEGIVNNANYLHYMEHTRHEFCEWAGFRFRDSKGSHAFRSHSSAGRTSPPMHCEGWAS